MVDVAWLPKLQMDTAARLAHSSTAIEGNPLTLPDVQAMARGEEIGASAQAQNEVLNYLAVLRWIWSRKAQESLIKEPDLLRLHRMVTRKTLQEEHTGNYKTQLNRVVDGRGHLIYTPPAPEQARPLTQALLAWVNCAETRTLHPILVGAIAHHRLVSLHPFADGNGRTARALGTWLLYTRGFDTHHLFALDEFFWADRPLYYQKIQQARDLDDDLSFWLEYVAQGVVETLRRTKDRIASLQVSARAPRIVLTQRQEDVLRFLRDQGRVRAADMGKAFKFSRARLGQVINPLVDAGLVLREGRTRATSYRLA